MNSMPPLPPIDVLLLRERECDELQMMLEVERGINFNLKTDILSLQDQLRDARNSADFNRRCHEGVSSERDTLKAEVERLRKERDSLVNCCIIALR